jgi:NAD(P) transhydrogenase
MLKWHPAASVDGRGISPLPEGRSEMRYDLVVIGSGPAGQKGAIAAAKLNKRVAMIERSKLGPGGVCVHSGTIPSKTMREAILHLTGFRQRDVFGDRYRDKRKITMQDLKRQIAHVIEHEIEVIHDQLDRNGIDLYRGDARFAGPHEIVVQCDEESVHLEAGHVLVACGTKPARPANIPFDGKHVFDSDEVLQLETIPRSMIVVGGGVIGCEYASILATLGIPVVLVERRPRLLEFVDSEIIESLQYQMRSIGVTLRFNEEVTRIEKSVDNSVAIYLKSGKKIGAPLLMYSVGRIGATRTLALEKVGIQADERGRIKVNENFQTAISHIYAVGDVVGFPALASTSMQQGRHAACHALGLSCETTAHLLPYGIYAIPEISMVGRNEDELTRDGVPYEIGVARYREIARGQIIGDTVGMLKLLFHSETRHLLGVHVIGEGATELVHIGQAVMALGGKLTDMYARKRAASARGTRSDSSRLVVVKAHCSR